MHADPTEAIRAIKAMQCSPDNVASVLSALETRYGEFLAESDNRVGGTGYDELLKAFEVIADFSDWWAADQRRAA